ncbi:MAG TPA: DUF554 domain-containing protein [Acidimicrobiales bacterium]|nr:DUF554 domain-containing protein [Acidimicrobiales bacterium]
MRGLGTLVNVATVLAGTAVGLVAGRRVPDRMRETVLSGIGLLTIGVGIASFLATENAVFPVVSIVIGGVIGESLRLDDRLERAGERLRLLAERGRTDLGHSRFVEGFVTATLTFCVGALTIVGSLQDGISGDAQLLIVKAALDGIVAVVYTAVFGIGVAFSAVSILVLQGLVTGLGIIVGDNLLDDRMVAEMEATGGPMIVGIGLLLLNIKRIRLASLLPGLAVAPVLVAIFAT